MLDRGRVEHHTRASLWGQISGGDDGVDGVSSGMTSRSIWSSCAKAAATSAAPRVKLAPDTTDLLLVQLTLSGDCLATIEVYAAAEYSYEVSAEIVGERGTASTGRPASVIVREAGMRSAAVPMDWLARFQAAYVAEPAQWARSLRTGESFAGASARDVAMALLITDACVRSLHSRQPVALHLPARSADPCLSSPARLAKQEKRAGISATSLPDAQD